MEFPPLMKDEQDAHYGAPHTSTHTQWRGFHMRERERRKLLGVGFERETPFLSLLLKKLH